MSKPRLADITRAHSRRDQRELELRLAFEDRRPMDVVITFDDVEKIASRRSSRQLGELIFEPAKLACPGAVLSRADAPDPDALATRRRM
jgi:hypothetical protein